MLKMMKKFLSAQASQCLAVISFAVLPLSLAAQLSPPVQRTSVVISPGDTLNVHVYDTPEMDQKVLVDDNGNAPLLFIGAVALGGKTPLEAAEAVRSAMLSRQLMQHPQVAVTIDQGAALGVAVGGEVNHPGAFPLTAPRSVLDLLAMAGGLTPLADRHILVEHRGPAASAEKFFVSNDPYTTTADLKVWPGDRIIVPKAGIVYVLGDVGRPGGYSLASVDSPITLLQSLALAESPNKTALYGRIKLLRRDGQSYTLVPVNVNDIKAGKAPDPVLQPNDVVMVTFSYIKNFAVNSTSVVNSLGTAAIYTHF
jgi:polysaccharide export outer membrane protein